MMKILARRLERQLQKNLQQHVLANEMESKLQRMKECFPGKTLPFPMAKVIAAWNDVPNETVDTLPICMKPGLSLRAPPPTPMGFVFDTEDTTCDDSSADGSSDDGWLLVNGTDTPTFTTVAFRDGPSLMSPYAYPDQLSNQQIDEDDSYQSTDGYSPTSDYGSLSSSSSRTPQLPVGFYNMVGQWLLDYRTRGPGRFIESLVAFGVMSLETAPLASRIGRAVIKMIAKPSYTEGKDLELGIRRRASAAFEKYWGPDGMEASSTQTSTTSPTPYGINIACLMGSLFDAGISSARDVHRCLSLLTGGEKRLDCLHGIHALLVRANDKLCKSRYISALTQFRDEITLKDSETGEYLWVTTPQSKVILIDILTTIEKWHVSQAVKRDQLGTYSHAIRQRAVGPRLCSEGRSVEPLVTHT